MAATEVVFCQTISLESAKVKDRAGIWISAALMPLAIILHGYHPYAEDGGVYLAGIKHLLDPRLYPAWSGFVTAHLGFSLFAPLTAALVRMSGLGLMTVLFLLYSLSIWMTLYAGWQIAWRCTQSRVGCVGAVALLTLLLTVPVAGTSLILVDPYLTARGFSSPCGLLALVAAIDFLEDSRSGRGLDRQHLFLCLAFLSIAGAMHPLMALYALGCILFLACMWIPQLTLRAASLAGLSLFSITMAGCVEWLSSEKSAEYARVAHTRTYWFLSTWRWYELLGLAAPLLLMTAMAYHPIAVNRVGRNIAGMLGVAGGTAAIVAILFARESSPSYMVARLQPLRIYHMVYLLMFLLLGMVLGEAVLNRHVWRWAALFVALGGTMTLVQEATFPHSTHLELPWRAPENPWEQAFVWIRDHTPRDAAFALDADYITSAGEDSQNFRAISERSAMPDDAKDGGIASIAPSLTREWIDGEAAQTGLDHGVNATTVKTLQSFSVSWIVLPAHANADFACPFENDAVKVCRLASYGTISAAHSSPPRQSGSE